MEKGRVVVPPLEAEERPESVTRLEEAVASRLPLIDLPDLLIEVDQWTGFSYQLCDISGAMNRAALIFSLPLCCPPVARLQLWLCAYGPDGRHLGRPSGLVHRLAPA